MAAIALTSAFAAPAASEANRLFVRTGPGLKIELRNRAGREVDYLRRGKHTIAIRDTSRSHNVVLTRWNPIPGDWRWRRGPQRVVTSFAFVGTKTVTVTLTPGRYTVSCLRHSSGSPFAGSEKPGMSDPFLVE
jgi:hypothetical protein